MFFVVLIMASPFLFAKSLEIETNFIAEFLSERNPIALLAACLIISMVILIISSVISTGIYKKADLS